MYFELFFYIFLQFLLISIQQSVVPIESFLSIDGGSIAIGNDHMCVLEQFLGSEVGGRAVCWGADDHDKINSPKDVVFIQISSSPTFTCGITLEQTVQCWGQHSYQPFGLFSQISLGDFFGCGVLTDGRISCWGVSPIKDRAPTFHPHDNSIKYVQVSCSHSHCCALDETALVTCWSGNPSLSSSMSPPSPSGLSLSLSLSTPYKDSFEYQPTVGQEEGEEEEEEGREGGPGSSEFPLRFKQVAVGGASLSCGITLTRGDLICWGDSQTLKKQKIPVLLSGPFKSVSMGDMGVCVLGEGEGRVDQVRGLLLEEARQRLREQKRLKRVTEREKKRWRRNMEEEEEEEEEREGEEEEWNEEDDIDVVLSESEERSLLVNLAHSLPLPDSLVCFGVLSVLVPDPESLLQASLSPSEPQAGESLVGGWDQVSVGKGCVCAVNMYSELKCFGTPSHIHPSLYPADLAVA